MWSPNSFYAGFLASFVGQEVLNKDPMVWQDWATPINTFIPPSFPVMHLQVKAAYPPQKYVCKYKKIAKFTEITFYKNNLPCLFKSSWGYFSIEVNSLNLLFVDFLATFVGQGVINKDPMVWQDWATPILPLSHPPSQEGTCESRQHTHPTFASLTN